MNRGRDFGISLQGNGAGDKSCLMIVCVRQKYDAWSHLGEMTPTTAKEQYIDALKQIIETINLNSDVEKFIEVQITNCLVYTQLYYIILPGPGSFLRVCRGRPAVVQESTLGARCQDFTSNSQGKA